MDRHSVGLATASLAFLCLLGASPQEAVKRPPGAAALDAAVRGINGYNASGQSPLADDGEFLRRVMLDLVAYPPSGAQVKAFVADTRENKRAAIVDELLASDDFADYWARQLAEVYFGNYHDVPMQTTPPLSKAASARIVGRFVDWLRMKLQKDAPYSEIVSQMLDARGTDEGDPALAYKLSFYSGEGYAIEFANGAGRQLLGIRLVCARCHDAVFDRWTNRDYYGLADFIWGQKARTEGGTDQASDRVKLSYAEEGDISIPDLHLKGKGVEQSETGPVKPVLLGIAEAPKGTDRMKFLSQLLPDKRNPQFARATANRIWSWLFGRGVVQPVDDFREKGNPPLSKGLLDVLTREFTGGKYSIKQLVRTICATEAYQRSCHGAGLYTKVDFSRGSIKQLNGEQLVNALRVATGGKPLKDTSMVLQLVGSLFPAGAQWCETTPLPGNARQALLLRNNSEIAGWINGPVLQGIKSSAGSLEFKVEEMFLAALSRLPEDSERARYATFLKGHPGQGFEDAYWTLLNSSEFVTRH
ncbi:MAG TPA: DUF1549 domain-containing protein [Planctomycetota bacterium]|jgi:hypothetical protein|nr:DUF1549 domain-containing protein [Planctomycetota bacterium]